MPEWIQNKRTSDKWSFSEKKNSQGHLQEFFWEFKRGYVRAVAYKWSLSFPEAFLKYVPCRDSRIADDVSIK